MSKPIYDDRAISAYLLGLLPEAEAERFDELSFTDEEFAGALAAAEKDLVDAYARGELSGASLEAFKSYYLASPLRRGRAEFAEAFRDFSGREAAAARASAETVAALEGKPRRRNFAGLLPAGKVFAFWNPALRWGAAALLLLALGGWLLTSVLRTEDGSEAKRETPAPNQSPDFPAAANVAGNSAASPEKEIARANEADAAREEPAVRERAAKKEQAPKRPAEVLTPPLAKPPPAVKINVASFLLAPPLRDGSRIQALSIPGRADEVALGLQLEADDYAAYRVALADESGKSLWRSGRIRAQGEGENKRLGVRFPAKLLRSRIYSLVVSGVGPNGSAEVISNYPFRAVLK